METIISIDVETTGPVPGIYDMLELGAAALQVSPSGKLTFNTFEGQCSFNYPDDGDKQTCWATDTYQWWNSTESNKAHLAEIHRRGQPTSHVMFRFQSWVEQFQRPVLAGFPIAFDAAFVNYNWWKYSPFKPPFSHSGIDIKTMAADLLGIEYRAASKAKIAELMPSLFNGVPHHNHRGLSDAIGQGVLYHNIKTELERARGTIL